MLMNRFLGDEPLYDNDAESPDVSAGLDIPISISEMSYGWRISGNTIAISDVVDFFIINGFSYFVQNAQMGSSNSSWQNLPTDMEYFETLANDWPLLITQCGDVASFCGGLGSTAKTASRAAVDVFGSTAAPGSPACLAPPEEETVKAPKFNLHGGPVEIVQYVEPITQPAIAELGSSDRLAEQPLHFGSFWMHARPHASRSCQNAVNEAEFPPNSSDVVASVASEEAYSLHFDGLSNRGCAEVARHSWTHLDLGRPCRGLLEVCLGPLAFYLDLPTLLLCTKEPNT
ncbi:hypothetical protein B0H13DRAFT_1859655 [Mycena leptocephala]|nr:hypothetical protein B0H13DRAFT_1859655 [Mycena leptocephala]